MLRLTQPQLSFYDAGLPPELLQLDDELANVDALLDDADVLAPFVERFSCRIGRPTVPVDTFLRLMYLKFLYDLGFEMLVKMVSDSLKLRKFCRIPLHASVPDASTLIKLRKKYGPELIAEVNKRVADHARARKLIRGRKLRVDTTVVPADIHYPTDAGLLADGVRTITRCVKRLQGAGVGIRTVFRDRTRSVRKRILAINKVLKRRTGEAWDEVRAITGEVMEIAEKTSRDAHRMLRNVDQTIRRSPKRLTKQVRSLTEQLDHFVHLADRVIDQTFRVQDGQRSIPERIVSLFDTGARPIRKGKLKASTEFGYKVLIQETQERIVTGYRVLEGNPGDQDLIMGAVEHHEACFGASPEEVAADRGFYSAKNERDLYSSGVRRVSIPKPGRLSKARKEHQRQHWFRRLQRFRAGGEATISLYKRKYGGGRSRFRGKEGTEAWVGWGIMSLNLRRLARMT